VARRQTRPSLILADLNQVLLAILTFSGGRLSDDAVALVMKFPP
jgi:hypothetical protein